MKGYEVYNDKYKTKIENLLKANQDKTYLLSFNNYMSNLLVSTKYDYLNYVVNFLNYCKKEDVSKIDLDDYINFMATISERTSSYQISVYSGLKKFSKYLYASGKSTLDPMKEVARPSAIESQETIEKRSVGYLTKKEIEMYISNVEKSATGKKRNRATNWKERDLAIIMTFLSTGMRCSALYKLDVSSINFEEHKIISTEKRGKIREYYFTDELGQVLLNWITVREQILINKGIHNEDALFISCLGRRMDNSCIYDLVNKYASSIPNKHITPHKLRATYGTQLYDKTKDIYFVQQCMGHSSPKTTELYVRGQKDYAATKAADLMGAILFK